jgi:hypothetical protein
MNAIDRQIVALMDEATGLLRRSIALYAKAGGLIAKRLASLERGEKKAWYDSVGLSATRASRLVCCWRYFQDKTNVAISQSSGLERFLWDMRNIQKNNRRKMMRERKAEFAHKGHIKEGEYLLHHADCKKFRWPAVVDCIATDPIWDKLDDYRWLARFAKKHLRQGGLCMVQVGTKWLLEVGDIMRAAGLRWLWELDIVYRECKRNKCDAPFGIGHQPVLVFSQGRCDGKYVGCAAPIPKL